MTEGYPRLFSKVNVLEGKSGNWHVQKFCISEDEAKLANIRATFSFSERGRYIYAGNYTRLMRGGCVVMSDTPAEARDHNKFARMAQGNVLMNGLGLGFVLKAILDKTGPSIDSVTVIEMSDDVIKLVAPFYNDPRVTIVHDNALKWKAPKGIHYNAVWHDIWDNICADNLPDMHRLHRRYGRRADWQGSWARELIQT